MSRRSKPPALVIVLIAVVVVAVGAYAWWQRRPPPSGVSPEPPAVSVPADRIDPANEGRVVEVSGDLQVQAPARDSQLGVEADASAMILVREVEMRQWQEQCSGEACSYRQIWSSQLIDSSRFRQPESHRNPDRMPVTSARFAAPDVRLGAFRIDAAAFDMVLRTRPVPFPVTSAKLPSNLAASFRDADGALYTGDPAKPAVGDVRVRYRVVPAGRLTLTGIQRGDRLIPRKSTASP